jgi:hypothetical protein
MGEVIVVPVANPIGLTQKVLGERAGRVKPLTKRCGGDVHHLTGSELQFRRHFDQQW